jgi:outer membrane protein assembly factor BamD
VEAKQKFEEFVKEHPDAVLSEEAEKNIEQLQDKEAEGNYNIARFYERQKQFSAAKIYYQDLIERYPESAWAAKALERVRVMENKK